MQKVKNICNEWEWGWIWTAGGERAPALYPPDPPSPGNYEGLRPSNSPFLKPEFRTRNLDKKILKELPSKELPSKELPCKKHIIMYIYTHI